MKFKYYLSCLFLFVILLTGCGRSFDSQGYLTSIMDVLYKGDYTAYMDFTVPHGQMSHFTEISGFPNPQTHSLQLSVPDSHPKKPLTVYRPF